MMKLHKKNILNRLPAILLSLLVFVQTSCKKEEPIKFSANSFLYFLNTYYLNVEPNYWVMPNVYQAETPFTFYNPTYQLASVSTNSTIGGTIPFPLSIQMDGKLSDHKRMISLELEGNGKEYCVLPPADSLYIPAKGLAYILNLKFIRPPLSDTSTKTVTLILKNNDGFSPEEHVWHKTTYKFGNWCAIPLSYANNAESAYGAFSSAKMYAIINGVAKVQNWSTDPDVITLNALLNQYAPYGLRPVKVNPFTMDELYYFISLPSSVFQYVAYAGSAGDIAYKGFRTKMINLTKALIVEKRNAGQPILDQVGNEITFP